METPSILHIMTELTSLSPNGVVIIKPFRAWFGIPTWQNKKIGMRILNAGEIEAAMEMINNSSETSQDFALKIEIIARSLWSVDGLSVANKEDLNNYNELHKTELTEIEYKRFYVKSFEHYVVEHLYNVYNELQKKQSRKVFGIYECAVTKKTFTKIPEGSKTLLYNTSEIICPEGLAQLTENDIFDFEGEIPISKQKEPTPKTTEQPLQNLKTIKDFDTMDEYKEYLGKIAEQESQHAIEATTV